MTKTLQQTIAANILVYKVSHLNDSTPVWNCAKFHNDEGLYLQYREVAYSLANKNQQGYQRLCEAFDLDESEDGYLLENNIKVIKKETALNSEKMTPDSLLNQIYSFICSHKDMIIDDDLIADFKNKFNFK